MSRNTPPKFAAGRIERTSRAASQEFAASPAPARRDAPPAPRAPAPAPRPAASAAPPSVVRAFRDDIVNWSTGRLWIARIPVLLYLLYLWASYSSTPAHQSLFKGLNLGIHELGHYVFGPFGDLLAAWGGSLLQCLAPLVAAFVFLRQRDYFGVTFALGWLGTNYFEVGAYAADAVTMSLPLVTPGGGHPIHDWNYILGDLGWLRHTPAIANLHFAAAHAMMAASIGFGSALLVLMIRNPRPAAVPTSDMDLDPRVAELLAERGISFPAPSGQGQVSPAPAGSPSPAEAQRATRRPSSARASASSPNATGTKSPRE